MLVPSLYFQRAKKKRTILTKQNLCDKFDVLNTSNIILAIFGDAKKVKRGPASNGSCLGSPFAFL